jgi:hypothetical protein
MSVLEAAIQLAYWGPIVLFSIGAPAALFNAIVFISVKTYRQSPTTYYVIGQSIADVATLLIVLLQIIPSTSVNVSSIACKLMIFAIQLTLTCAMSFLCLAAFDRWACTSQSARIRQLSSTRIARRLFLLPFLFWSLINIPFLIYCDLIPPFFTCGFTNDLFEQIALYFLNPILSTILPLLVLSTFCMLTYRNIRVVTRVRQQPVRTRLSMWEQQMTRMMLAQTLLSISCTLPRSIFVIYTIATVGGRATRSFNRLSIETLVDQLTLIIICVNFASSFYIFLLASARFRETIKMYLKRLLHLGHNQIGPTNISLTQQRLTTRQIARGKADPPIEMEEL